MNLSKTGKWPNNFKSPHTAHAPNPDNVQIQLLMTIFSGAFQKLEVAAQ